jgi:hypothetical protein
VAGLTEKEMPGKVFVHVQIPRLYIGGGGVMVDSNQQLGHLFLMRNTEDAEKVCFRNYQEHILIPGINLQRKKYCNFDITAGTTIPNTATAVAWCDGDISRIDSIKQSVDLYVEDKIIADKQNAAWSGVEQPADLAPVFKSIKRIQNKHTVWDIPLDRCPMKRLISDMFHPEKLEFLSLKSSKKNALIDFLSVLPDIATSVCSKESIKHGFLEAGIINDDYHCYPVFNKILSTCCQRYSQYEYNSVVKSFKHFLNIMDEEGHILKERFDLCGFQMDKDINRDEAIRLANISQERYQRSKCLTHLHQVNLHLEHLQTIKSKEIEKKTTANLISL